MMTLLIPDAEYWNEQEEIFIYRKGRSLRLEHSLVSLSKWESKHEKPFLSKEDKSHNEIVDYIRCMTLDQNVDPDVYLNLTEDNLQEVESYIDAPMTATTFRNDQRRGNSGEQVTAELIYYWMISLGIPFECQKWHLNKLLTLIRVCSIKNQPKKHSSTREIMRRNSSLNAARRKRYNTRG